MAPRALKDSVHPRHWLGACARPFNFTVRRRIVRIAIQVTLTVVLGCAVAWALLVGFCSVPGIRYSTACGHNAYVWLPIALPIGLTSTWFVSTWALDCLWKRG